MNKRVYRSSSDDERLAEEIDEIDLDSTNQRQTNRTTFTGKYQSEIYNGLISFDRRYNNGERLTRLEQLVTLYHDDQIRSILLSLRHFSMKHQWKQTLIYLKYLLQSSFCRAYLRLYWQLIFRYLLDEYRSNSFDIFLLSQIFDNLFHSPTINRSQTFYSYLCLHLLHPNLRHFYIDIETRYKNLPRPFSSGRCRYSSSIVRFDPKFEQLLLINLHFLDDYRQWLDEYSFTPTTINPFVSTTKISLENERNLELWTFKLTTNFHEIQLISNEYFDHYDPFLLKYLLFLIMTETNVEQISLILRQYIEQHPSYLNAYRYHYWFDQDLNSLKKFVELDPSSSPYVLIYCQKIFDQIEIFDRLFDYFDYEKNKFDYSSWKFFAKILFEIDEENSSIIECLRDNWKIRRSIWKKFHFQIFNKIDGDKAKIAYVFCDERSIRIHLSSQSFFTDDEKRRADRLHQRVMMVNSS